MIYTLTMNPAIDLFCQTEKMLPEVVNRTIKDDIQPNGKGVNVSFVLKQLGIDNMAYGFGAGFTGKYIQDALTARGIKEDFIMIEGEMTRINVFIRVNGSQEEYKIVNQGPYINALLQAELLDKISCMKAGDILCVSGSLPQGCQPNLLIQIAQICDRKQIHLVIDSSYQEVLDCLPYAPLLLKPNEEELGAWFDQEMKTDEDYIYYAKQLIKRGSQGVLLSLGARGAFYVDRKSILKGNAPNGTLVNTACAGDTLLATFLAYRLNGSSLEECLKQAIAAGSSTAFREGITDFSDVAQLAAQIMIKKVEV